MNITAAPPTSGKLMSAPRDIWGVLARLVKSKEPDLEKGEIDAVIQAIRSTLEGSGALESLVRRNLQHHLVDLNAPSPVSSPSMIEPRMLTTEEAAQMMGRSRPYVAMLIDAGKLVGATKSPKGHRKVPESSVKSWMDDHPPMERSASHSDYRMAALEAGMYDIPEASYIESQKAVKKSTKASQA